MTGALARAVPVLLLVAALALGALLARTVQLSAGDGRAVERALAVGAGDPDGMLVARAGAVRAGGALARSAVTRLLSYDGRTFDADVAAALRRLAPEQRPGYAEAMRELRVEAVRDAVRVRAVVVAEAALVATDTEVRSLLMVDLVTAREGRAGRRTDRVRVLATLHRDRRGWLVTGLSSR